MSSDPAQEFLKLLENPYGDQIQQASIWFALGTSLGFTAFIALVFSFLRPYNQAVYAPKLKHADERHAPPPMGKKPWSWFVPIWKSTEKDIIEHVGMDAAVFLRFVTMCRDLFLVLSVLGLAILVPVHFTQAVDIAKNRTWLSQTTPLNVFGEAHWAQVVVAWLFTFIIMGFLWWNYRKILHMRLEYFQSQHYQNSLHSRTLMMYDIPKERCSDEGIARIIDEVAPNSSFSRTAIARNVKDLPDLIGQHERTVRKLEKVLAKYMKNPADLPPARPTCLPSKKDPSYSTYPRNQKVDAIEYLTQRIKELEVEIKEVRASVDRRSTMPYGFASYADIAEAHSIAFACRKKKPAGATIRLAPRPNDVIWDNMPLNAATRSRRRFMNNIWVTLLTFVWIAPNAMIAIFLANMANLGLVWPAFQESLRQSPTWWAFFQGIASPALTSLVFLVLPIIFRRMSIQAGDQTKTGRERHVTAKLYAFFVFNLLIVFSLFSVIWSFVAGVVKRTGAGTDAWQAILEENFGATLFISVCNISPFWVTWLLQRQLGAAIDLSQLWQLIYSWGARTFSNPTPRDLIELTAPPAFDYASYYNYFLFYSTVALAYAGLQPIVLPAAALYFCIDVWLKKYLLLYVFITKTESGGMFWRVLFNRFLFATILANLVVFLTVWVRGEGTHIQAYAVAPLPFIVIAFKIFCARSFDHKMYYCSTHAGGREAAMPKEQQLRSERLAARFGHPALYKPLITPMVHSNAQASLHLVYKGRLSDGREAGSGDVMSTSGYSDTFALDPMKSGKPGKQATVAGFEFVSDAQMDFEFFKNRPEFADEHGQGELFGRPADFVRPGTPGSAFGGDDSRPSSPSLAPLQGGMTGGRRNMSVPMPPRSTSPGFQAYRPSPPGSGGYASPTTYGGAPQVFSPQPIGPGDRSRTMYSMANGSDTGLVRHAAPLATPGSGGSREQSLDRYSRDQSNPRDYRDYSGNSYRAPSGGAVGGSIGGGPRGYSNVPQTESLDSPPLPGQGAGADPSQYDYFRGRRHDQQQQQRRQPSAPGQERW